MKCFLLSMTLLMTTALTSMANAQSNKCGEREVIVTFLATEFGEVVQSVGISNNNGLVEMYANTETGSWSLVFTHPTGVTCLTTYGRSYENIRDTIFLDDEPV